MVSITQFHNDLIAMLRVAIQLDKFYVDSRHDIDAYLDNYIKLTLKFNEKYKHLSLKVVQKIDSIDVKLLVDLGSLKEAYEAANKVPGLNAVGARGFKQGAGQDASAMAAEVEKATDELYLSYMHNEIGFSSIYLRFDQHEKKVEVVYDYDSIENMPNPEFQFVAQFGIKDVDNSIRINNEAAAYGFTDWLYNWERQKYLRKYDPHFTY